MKGSLTGIVLHYGELDFIYQHIARTALENGKIELSDSGNGQVEIVLKENLC